MPALLLCVRKPLMLWTDGPMALNPEPDAYSSGISISVATRTAPYPGNNLCIKPGNNRADKFYLDSRPAAGRHAEREVGAAARTSSKWPICRRRMQISSVCRADTSYPFLGGEAKNADIVLSGLPTLPGTTASASR